MAKGICLLSLALLLVWSKEISGQTTESDPSTSTEDPKPCGDFPWARDDVRVDCDYSYHEIRRQWNGSGFEFLGRCNVTCLEEAELLVGPPYNGHDPVSINDGAYFCNRDNRTWLGAQPVCLGRYNKATMVTDESNTIRLVGGEFYGCVELYDNVTQQWGPVRGWDKWIYEFFSYRMGWADLACKNLGFPAGLATQAYPFLVSSVPPFGNIADLSSYYAPRYPSTVPKFIVSGFDQLPTADNATLHDAIARVVRGPCPSVDLSCNAEGSTMCLACADSKPCGDFPWDTDDVTVDCDYSYHEIRRRWGGPIGLEIHGRCSVTCPEEADLLVGPPISDNDGNIHDGVYFCNRRNRTWLGAQPVCLGRYNNATMVTDESNGIRLVGGEFYGCVELYDNVTQQWGPVRGLSWFEDYSFYDQRMALVDFACRNLGFSGLLATIAYRLLNGTIYGDRWQRVPYLNYYYMNIANVTTYPPTAPKFILRLPEHINTSDSVSLHDAIERVVRGPCEYSDYRCDSRYDTMCLACAGQRQQDDSPAISAQVTCTSDSIRVSFPRPVDNSIQLEDVQLAALPCSADQNSTHIYIDAPLTGCGTSRQDTEDDIIYRNTLTINANGSSAIITRHRFTEISVECRLPRRKTVSVNFDPENLSVFRSHIVGRGEFVISMELHLSNSFRSPVLVYPLSAELGQMLYVQLQMTSDDTNLQVFADSCMATPTEQPDDSNVLYHLIRDGCDEDSTVARYWSPSTMQERFGFQAFAFTSGARKVYLHCDVLLCNATDPNSRCARGCQAGRRRREAADDSDVYQLIQGPIVLKDDQAVRDDASTGHTVNMVSLFMGACAVLVVAILIGI